MTGAVKGLLIITSNLLVLMLIGFLWLTSIKEKRIERLKGHSIEIISWSSSKLLESKDVERWMLDFFKIDYKKIPLYKLQLKQLEDYISKQALVDKVELYIDSKAKIHIKVEERKPLVRIHDVSGKEYYLDAEGYKLPVSSQYGARVPVATGSLIPTDQHKLSKQQQLFYKSILNVGLAISQDSFMNALVEQIDQDENGEITLIPKIGTEKIILGSAENIADKLSRVKLFYRENMGRQGWNVYQSVNVKFKGQIIGKKLKQES